MSRDDSATDETAEVDQQQSPKSESNKSTLRRVLTELVNWGLISDSREAIQDTDWYVLSLTTLYVGFLGLLCWSAYISFSLALSHLITSQGILDLGSRIVSVAPLTPVAIFIFAIWSNRAGMSMRKAYLEDQPSAPPKFTLGAVSTVAFVAAGTYRWALYLTLHDFYGTSPTAWNVISILIVDGLHLSLLLVGFGSAGTLIFAPTSEAD